MGDAQLLVKANEHHVRQQVAQLLGATLVRCRSACGTTGWCCRAAMVHKVAAMSMCNTAQCLGEDLLGCGIHRRDGVPLCAADQDLYS